MAYIPKKTKNEIEKNIASNKNVVENLTYEVNLPKKL